MIGSPLKALAAAPIKSTVVFATQRTGRGMERADALSMRDIGCYSIEWIVEELETAVRPPCGSHAWSRRSLDQRWLDRLLTALACVCRMAGLELIPAWQASTFKLAKLFGIDEYYQ